MTELKQEFQDKMKKDVSFAEVYEHAMSQILMDAQCSETADKELKRRRDFGLKKYEDFAFQSNFKNCMTAPAIGHMKEEILDAINYCLHYIYQGDLLGYSNECTEDMNQDLLTLIHMFNKLTRKREMIDIMRQGKETDG
jgi:hypothetical protein